MSTALENEGWISCGFMSSFYFLFHPRDLERQFSISTYLYISQIPSARSQASVCDRFVVIISFGIRFKLKFLTPDSQIRGHTIRSRGLICVVVSTRCHYSFFFDINYCIRRRLLLTRRSPPNSKAHCLFN